MRRSARLPLVAHDGCRFKSSSPQASGSRTPLETEAWKQLDRANHFAELGNVLEATKVLESLICGWPKGIRRPTTMLHNTGLKAFANAGDLDGAQRWYDHMSDARVRVNAKTYGKMIEAAAKAGEYLAAEEWSVRSYADGFPPQLTHLGALGDASAKFGDPQRAQAWLSRGLAFGDTKQARGAVVNAWARVADPRRALLAYGSALAAGSREEEVCPKAWSSVLTAYAKDGDLVQAERWMESGLAKKVRMDGSAYTAMIQGYSRTGHVAGAEKWSAAMLKKGFEFDGISRSLLLQACARKGDAARVELWLWRFAALGWRMGLYELNAAIDVCGRAGDPARAESWLQKAEGLNLKPDVVSHTAVVGAYLRTPGHTARALDLLKRMVKKGPKPNELTYNMVLGGLAAARDVDQAEYWYRQMLSDIGAPNVIAHNSVIGACAKRGDAARAECWFARMGWSSVALVPDEFSHTTLMDAYAQCADVDNVERIFHEFSRSSPGGATALAFAVRMRPWALRGDYRRVEELWGEMDRLSIKQEAHNLWALLKAYAEADPPRSATAAQRYKDWVASGGGTDHHVLRALRQALGDRPPAAAMRDRVIK